MQLPKQLQPTDTPGTLEDQEVSTLWHQLTDKQRSWLMEYLSNGLNATQAVKDSAYQTSEDDQCRAMGHQNRTHPKIRPLIQHACRRHMTENEVLKHVSHIARATWEDFLSFTDGGRVVPDLQKARQRGKMKLVDKIKWDAEYDEEKGEVVRYVKKLQLKDSQKAHDQLLKATGAFDLEEGAQVNAQNVTINQWNQELNAHLQGEGDRWPQVKEVDE